MTNKTSKLLSNGIKTSLTVAAGPIYSILVDSTNDSPDIIPKPGDIIIDTANPPTIPSNTTILTANASYATATKTKWTLTFSKTITSATGAVVKIGINQDYDNAWRGDAAFLEDKFVRFSYRFKFEDNEYSLMAPFTQPMFIPKQFSEFGAGGNTNTVDMDNAYKSTILNWFENNIENIVLKTPMPYSSPALNVSKLLITDIDLLYKESDALAVKVLDTVDITSLSNQSTNFSATGKSSKNAPNIGAHPSDNISVLREILREMLSRRFRVELSNSSASMSNFFRSNADNLFKGPINSSSAILRF